MSGPSPDGLSEGLRRIGIDLKWDDLGRSVDVQKALRTSGTRETAKQVQNFLKDAIRRRHNIVHKSDSAEQLTEAQVSDAIATFRALAKSLVEIVARDCRQKSA